MCNRDCNEHLSGRYGGDVSGDSLCRVFYFKKGVVMDTLIDQIAAAEKAMHEAPMNKVFTDHLGNKSLGTHSNAWAKDSREWMELRQTLKNKESST